MENKKLFTHVFDFSPNENGGESLTLTTKFFANGDKITRTEGVYLNQILTLNSYGNSASFDLCGINITTESLRQLANELESYRLSLIPTTY